MTPPVSPSQEARYHGNRIPKQKSKPTNHLNRQSTPIQQRTSSAGTALAAPVLSTVLKPAGAPSCINHQTLMQNIHWDSPVDTEFTSQDPRATSHQGIVANETYMNLSSSQHTLVITTTGCHIQLSTDNTENKDTNNNDAGKETYSA